MAVCCSYAMTNQSLLQHQIEVAIFIISLNRALNFTISFALSCCCEWYCCRCHLLCCCCNCYNSHSFICAAPHWLLHTVRRSADGCRRSVRWLVFLLIKTVCFCFCVRLHTVILLHSSSYIHTYSYMLPDSVFILVHFGFGPFVSSTVCSQSTPWNFASFHRMACVIGPHIPLFLVILVAFHGLCSKRSGFLCPFLLLIIWNVHMMFLHSMSVSVYIYM